MIGIGNSGRSDDGLGWSFLECVEKESFFEGQIEYRYQLQVEDADLISKSRRVIFVDAHKGELENGFEWSSCEPSKDFAFTTHVLPPAAILYLCRELSENIPDAYTLAIQGHKWELEIGLTPEAKVNLEKALEFFRSKLEE